MEALAANLAYTFHWSPEDTDRLNHDDMIRWSKHAKRIKKEIESK